jgi:hypothetical protein
MFAALCLGAASGPFLAAADDVMRCRNNSLVNVGMVSAEVVARCGAPKDKSETAEPIRVRHANGTISTVGHVRVERWTYDRGYGQFPALLVFEDGKLKSIELQTGR